MTRTTHHAPTAPPTEASPQRGIVATTFTVLRQHRRVLARATARVVGLCGLAWLLLTAAIFALSWPLFTHMRNQRLWYHYVEDPYLHDHSDLGLVALCTLPLFLLLLGLGTAALQRTCTEAVTGSQPPPEQGRLGLARLRPLLAVYSVRAVLVWSLPVLVEYVAHSLTGPQLDTPQPLAPGSWPATLVEASPAVAVCVAVLLRLALALAPAAAADGFGARAALRRSWSLAWTRAGARVFALALPLAVLTAGVLRLVVQLALPLRPLVRSLVHDATGNFFAGYYAGILAPVIVGILVAAALTLPLTCTAFAVLNERLPARRTRRAGEAADSAA